MKKTIILIICICIISIFILCFIFSLKKPVQNKQEAIKIAQDFVYEKYNNNFSDYKIVVRLEKNIWIVAYFKEGADLGGGGPEVHINKSNGKVIYCYLQR